MFIFSRPFRAVAAGLGMALLTICLDRACEPPGAAATALATPVHTARAWGGRISPRRCASLTSRGQRVWLCEPWQVTEPAIAANEPEPSRTLLAAAPELVEGTRVERPILSGRFSVFQGVK